MKQYTTPEQTAKLIELGFERPKNTVYTQVAKRNIGYGIVEWEDAGEEGSYSIGELIEMLPDYINGNFVNWEIHTTRGDVKWSVGWDCFETGQFQWIRRTELVNALYEMILKLKEEGVI